MMSISLRFILTLMQEIFKISKAEALRGVDFRIGQFNVSIKVIVPLLVSLFISAFKRAEELAMAMESRGYQGGEGRSKLRELKFYTKDYFIFVLFVVLTITLLLIRN